MPMYTQMLCDLYCKYPHFVLFNFDYVFYREDKKPVLEEMFMSHFAHREIGFETVDEFRWELRNVFREKLPFYNKLFELAEVEYDLLNNYNLREHYEKTGKEDGTAMSETNTSANHQETVINNVDQSTTEKRVGTDVENNVGETTTEGFEDTNEYKTLDQTTSEKGHETLSKTLEEGVTGHDTTVQSDQLNGTNILKDTGTIDVTVITDSTETQDGTTAHSDTPQGSLANLKSKSYASSADLIDNTNTLDSNVTNSELRTLKKETTDDQVSSKDVDLKQQKDTTMTGLDSTEKSNSGTTNDIEDITRGVETSSTGTTSENNTLNGNWATDGTLNRGEQSNTTGSNHGDSTTGSEYDKNKKEEYDLTRIGNIGVMTSADMLEKEIELRKKLTNLYNLFFENECDVLFMGVF